MNALLEEISETVSQGKIEENTSNGKPNDDRDNSAGDSDSHEVTIKKRESKHGFTKSKSSSSAKFKSSYASKDDLNSLSAYRSGYHFISEVGAL